MMNLIPRKKLILILTVFFAIKSQFVYHVDAIECNKDEFVFGENEIIDQLMTCSLSKSYDLDLTPRGEYLKSTSRALVEQGLSNKTSILYAKLNGLWSGKRTKYIDSGWRCQRDKTTQTSVLEFTGLSLEVIERVEVPNNQNSNKLSLYKPCKTFELPNLMCRPSRPVYKTVKTWINTAYLNVTLSQARASSRPTVEKVSLLFTCPETFKQKVAHSPSVGSILSKYINQELKISKRSAAKLDKITGAFEKKPTNNILTYRNPLSIGSPDYQSSVNLIVNHLRKSLAHSLRICIELLDIDLSLVREYNSFSNSKLNEYYDGQVLPVGETIKDINDLRCSDKLFVSQRIELANKAEIVEAELADKTKPAVSYNQIQTKRSQLGSRYPEEQLLDPHGFYDDNEILYELGDDNNEKSF